MIIIAKVKKGLTFQGVAINYNWSLWVVLKLPVLWSLLVLTLRKLERLMKIEETWGSCHLSELAGQINHFANGTHQFYQIERCFWLNWPLSVKMAIFIMTSSLSTQQERVPFAPRPIQQTTASFVKWQSPQIWQSHSWYSSMLKMWENPRSQVESDGNSFHIQHCSLLQCCMWNEWKAWLMATAPAWRPKEYITEHSI